MPAAASAWAPSPRRSSIAASSRSRCEGIFWFSTGESAGHARPPRRNASRSSSSALGPSRASTAGPSRKTCSASTTRLGSSDEVTWTMARAGATGVSADSATASWPSAGTASPCSPPGSVSRPFPTRRFPTRRFPRPRPDRSSSIRRPTAIPPPMPRLASASHPPTGAPAGLRGLQRDRRQPPPGQPTMRTRTSATRPTSTADEVPGRGDLDRGSGRKGPAVGHRRQRRSQLADECLLQQHGSQRMPTRQASRPEGVTAGMMRPGRAPG